mmetsp:Transcript_96440/g.245071  ORF Transcript_96440/g.245071 Transcript_96440/m.245071 type:complete len:213 (+) Transcript_96440:534-1172(+)
MRVQTILVVPVLREWLAVRSTGPREQILCELQHPCGAATHGAGIRVPPRRLHVRRHSVDAVGLEEVRPADALPGSPRNGVDGIGRVCHLMPELVRWADDHGIPGVNQHNRIIRGHLTRAQITLQRALVLNQLRSPTDPRLANAAKLEPVSEQLRRPLQNGSFLPVFGGDRQHVGTFGPGCDRQAPHGSLRRNFAAGQPKTRSISGLPPSRPT